MTSSHDRHAAMVSTRTATSLLFEVAWEVCNKVGGIYTVLRSKAPVMVQRWRDSYCLIGPYRESQAHVELEPQPPTGPIRDAINECNARGVKLHFGRWLITGRPQVILCDLASVTHKLGETKYLLWKDSGLTSPDHEFEYDESINLGYAVAEFLATLKRWLPDRPVLAHFHEWQAAAALPMLRHRDTPVGTVFTTHATLTGRNLCAANANLYEDLEQIDAAEVAWRHGFGHRHALEGAAAQACDVFTSVSDITGREAARFLGRQLDVVLPNGLNVERFAAPHEFQVLHREAKERIHEFVMGHFFPSYTFDLDQTLYVFTSGRYEYRNKGMDVFIDALAELNRRMRAESSPATVVAFIVTKADYRTLNVETLNRQAMFNEVSEVCEDVSEEMQRRLLHIIAEGRMPSLEELLGEYGAVRLKRMMYAMHRQAPPTIITHDLADQDHDPVLNHLRARQLWNMKDDRVKVIFHGDFMSAVSPLLGMEYDQFIRGCHLGVFPSYYEPWGYTPLECIVRGLPAITSDLSGFGAYVMENFPGHDEAGMYVTRRMGRSFGDAVQQVAGWMHGLTQMSRRARIALRNGVEAYAEHFDWNRLSVHYLEAYRLAYERRYGNADADTTRSRLPASTGG